MNPTLANAVELAIVFEWAYVVVYFLHRWWKHKRLVSFCLAAMAAGWLCAGLLEDHPAVKASALMLGLVLQYAIWRVERGEATTRS